MSSIPFDHCPRDLAQLYYDPRLLQLVSLITGAVETAKPQQLYHSVDPLGCCSINVFHPGDYHSFHFDESKFSTTLMLQEAETGGLFQHTDPLRADSNDLAAPTVARTIQAYDADRSTTPFAEDTNNNTPALHTLDFHPGTLSILAGSRSLHRVTTIHGSTSRLVAVLTFADTPGFCNSAAVQKMFWGRSAAPSGTTEQPQQQQ